MKTFTEEEIVVKTFAHPRGCEEGKVEYLRDALDITDPHQYLDRRMRVNARFQYATQRDDGTRGDRQARDEGQVRGMEIPGVRDIIVRVQSSARWTEATLVITDEAAFWDAILGDNLVDGCEFNVTAYDRDLRESPRSRCIMRIGETDTSFD